RNDLLVTGWRDLRLYRNLGEGRFEDITDRSGLHREGWSTSAVFADWDDDGDLDLFVARYLDYDPTTSPFCAAPDGRRDYCGPEVFPAQTDQMYRNVGSCRFEDVSVESGVALPGGRALGVLAADLTGDRRLDLFVANDGSPCRLFENRGDFRFQDVGMEAGVALDGGGKPLSGMGVALGDVDGDGQADLLVTNFLGRSTVGFRGLGHGLFADASAELGLKAFTADVLGFGLALEDFDADGDLDLIQANGHVLDRTRLGEPLVMRAKALRNAGGRFQDASDRAGPCFRIPMLGRGLATGDLDRDGRPDAVIAALDRPIVVLRNASEGRSLTINLEGRTPGSDVGAEVRASVDGRETTRIRSGGGSYLSASARSVYVPMGKATVLDELEVRWRSGRVDVWNKIAVRGVFTVKEGEGSSSKSGVPESQERK
ncbi:MAG TPA: CRTAC1 family protein, partial [Isosphaeraceae bacterium]|nr:CRTAC1 family protein [Isosphaeraceae bacterium]